jgi:glycosyltransferase involved in cell wall biosynthesis
MLTTWPSPQQPVGGVSTYSRALVQALRSEDSPDLSVFSQKTPPPEPGAIPCWEPGNRFRRQVKDLLARSELDTLHLQHEPFLFGSWPGSIQALNIPSLVSKLGMRCLATLHAVPFPSVLMGHRRHLQGIRMLAVAYLRALAVMDKGVDCFVVHESEQAETLTDFARISADRIRVIPHGITACSLPKKDDKGALTVGTFGFLAPYKDPRYLLEEWTEFARDHGNATLLFSMARHPRRQGAWYRRRYERIMNQARATPRVEVSEYLSAHDLDELLKACDLIVAPHRFEVSSSGVVARAVGAGVPVLVPECSGSVARLDGWAYDYEPGGLRRALARQSDAIGAMRQQAVRWRSGREWQLVAAFHRRLYA